MLNNKLLIPLLHPSVIKRPPLHDQLNKGLNYKLTLITAQAGYGKTTILSEWSLQCKAKVVWFSLDKYDNDFIPFWSNVLYGIEFIQPGFALNLWPILLNINAKSIDVFIMPLLHELQALTEDWVIVLDDFHFIEQDLINASFTLLLEHLPTHIHIYLASRSKPMFPTARLSAKKQLHTLDVEDLRFQIMDGIAFFQQKSELGLTNLEVTHLVNQSEGWVSGLQLAALAIEKAKNQSEFIQQFSGRQRGIAAYLIEEVFQQQTMEVQSFLLKTSILSEMNHAICEAVSHQMNCQDILENLEHKNLFLVPLDENRNWYRYHHLFADFLQHTLQLKHNSDYIQAHVDAGNWLDANGLKEAAVNHYLAAQQYIPAVQLIEQLLPQTHHSKWNVLHRWLSIIPDTFITGKPMIDIYYIGALIGVGEWELASEHIRQAELRVLVIKEHLNNEEWNQVGGTLYFFGGITAIDQRDFVRAQQYFEIFDTLMPEGNPIQMIGANSYGGTDHDDFLAWSNDLQTAKTYITSRIEAWGKKKNYPAIGYFLNSYSELLYEWNHLDEAKQVVGRVIRRRDTQPFARIMISSHTILAKIEHAQGNTASAILLLEQLKQQIDSPDQAAFLMKINTQTMRYHLLQDSNEAIASWLVDCGYNYADPITSSMFLDYIIYAEALAYKGQTEEALALLARLFQYANKGDRLRDMIKVRIKQSILLYHLDKQQDAFRYLIEALHLAQPQGYIRSFIDEGPTIAAMLYLIVNTPDLIPKNAPLDCVPYIKQLLEAYRSDLPKLATTRFKLTEQEVRILIKMEQGLSNKQIAEQIFVTSETVKSHVKNIFRKLRVNNRLQAVQQAKENNFI